MQYLKVIHNEYFGTANGPVRRLNTCLIKNILHPGPGPSWMDCKTDLEIKLIVCISILNDMTIQTVHKCLGRTEFG